eukprot:CAMPEP_0183380040 /NCGR_PEP_ID=MMETSP0164_2-20130417/125730_1 /TAXON_ID=221442 /ORGANISM="Coccolithus pelagicus ssp braarudi, Strain PLY182g" /LENGTH=148 /DNA_ID=CAMNT_0025557629 /DNA_START=51 /DNA_END=498 /DNA_ORIENTATION=-
MARRAALDMAHLALRGGDGLRLAVHALHVAANFVGSVGADGGNYLAPGFDEQPLWWRWSCGMAVLTCSACSLIPSRICTLLGLAVLAICLCLAPVYRAGAPVLAASLQWLQLFLFSKVAAFVLFLPLCSLVYSYLRVRQPRGPKQQIP